MVRRSSAIKVGVLALISLGVLIAVLLWLSGRSMFSGKEYSVIFPDVDGLKESAPVHFMGIRVGFVDDVSPELMGNKYQVKVTFHIDHPDMDNPDEDIPRGSKLTIQQSGLIGEKFLEITPPMPKQCRLNGEEPLKKGDPVVVTYANGPKVVGNVVNVEDLPTGTSGSASNTVNITTNRFATYRISAPGVSLPLDAACAVTTEDPNQLTFTYPKDPPQSPNTDGHFTIEAPMRLKTFLDVQMETAEALRDTNLKISQLLTDDTMQAITQTVANTEALTAKAAILIDSANSLVNTAQQDVHRLVATIDNLSESVSSVSNNVNSLMADGQLQEDLKATVASIRKASDSLQELLSDPALQQTLSHTRNTMADTSSIVAQLKNTTTHPNFQNDARESVTLLRKSLDELNTLLNSVNHASGPDNEDLKTTIIEAKQTVHQLKEFSDKLDGHFVLFRLLF